MDDKPKNDKLKNDDPRLNNVLFLVLWVAGHAASWVLALGVNQFLGSQGIFIYSNLVLALLMALGTGIPTAIVQLLLVERGLKKSMRGWLPVSIIGWALSGLAFYLLWENLPLLYRNTPREFFTLLPRLMFLPLFVPVATLQWLYLRRKMKSAGLWVMAALAGALLFAVPNGRYITGPFNYNLVTEYFLAAGAALLYSGTTGATMLYLWTQNRDKAKKDAALAQQSDENNAERLERLTDATGANLDSPSETYGTTTAAKTNPS